MAQQELKRDLKNRHVQLIAIGGTMGQGYFLGEGKAIQSSRILYNLSSHQQGPAAFARLNKNHVSSHVLLTSTVVFSIGAMLSELIP